jgi:hypothetical protein
MMAGVRRSGFLQLGLTGITVLLAGLTACESGGTNVGVSPAPRLVQALGPVPEEIASQRVRYASSNLLAGDTSFETPDAPYILEACERDPHTGAIQRSLLRPYRVSALTVHGQRALRVTGLTGGRERALRWPAVPLTPGVPYTFSTYVRSLVPMTRLELAGGSARLSPSTAFTPGPSWDRYELTFTVPASGQEAEPVLMVPVLRLIGGPAARSEAGTTGRWVEVDAVQLEPGAAAGPYRPRKPVDYGIAIREHQPVDHLPPGQPLKLVATLRNNTPVPVRLQLVWQVVDILTQTGPTQVSQTHILPGQEWDTNLDFEPLQAGQYLLKTYVRGGVDVGFVDQRELAVFDLPPGRVPLSRPFFGLSRGLPGRGIGPGSRATSRPAMDRLASSWPQRMVWRWDDIETQPGHDCFVEPDKSIDALVAQGAEPIVCLASLPEERPLRSGNPATRPAHRVAATEAVPAWALAREGAAAPAVDPRQYRQFVFRVVTHFRGRVRYWEAPPAGQGSGGAWTRLFREAVKLADPQALVVVPVESDSPPAAGRVASAPSIRPEGLSEADVVLHTFWCPGGPDPAGDLDRLSQSLAQLTNLLARAGRADVPHWELTPAWPGTEGMDPAVAASQIHRVALLLKRHGASRWLVPPPASFEPTLRLGASVEVTVLATLASWFGPATFRRERPVGPELTAMEFTGVRSSFAALVSHRGQIPTQPLTLALPIGVRATTLFGRWLNDGTWPTDLTVVSSPVYLWPTDERTEVLQGVAPSAAAPP